MTNNINKIATNISDVPGWSARPIGELEVGSGKGMLISVTIGLLDTERRSSHANYRRQGENERDHGSDDVESKSNGVF